MKKLESTAFNASRSSGQNCSEPLCKASVTASTRTQSLWNTYHSQHRAELAVRKLENTSWIFYQGKEYRGKQALKRFIKL